MLLQMALFIVDAFKMCKRLDSGESTHPPGHLSRFEGEGCAGLFHSSTAALWSSHPLCTPEAIATDHRQLEAWPWGSGWVPPKATQEWVPDRRWREAERREEGQGMCSPNPSMPRSSPPDGCVPLPRLQLPGWLRSFTELLLGWGLCPLYTCRPAPQSVQPSLCQGLWEEHSSSMDHPVDVAPSLRLALSLLSLPDVAWPPPQSNHLFTFFFTLITALWQSCPLNLPACWRWCLTVTDVRFVTSEEFSFGTRGQAWPLRAFVWQNFYCIGKRQGMLLT